MGLGETAASRVRHAAGPPGDGHRGNRGSASRSERNGCLELAFHVGSDTFPMSGVAPQAEPELSLVCQALPKPFPPLVLSKKTPETFWSTSCAASLSSVLCFTRYPIRPSPPPCLTPPSHGHTAEGRGRGRHPGDRMSHRQSGLFAMGGEQCGRACLQLPALRVNVLSPGKGENLDFPFRIIRFQLGSQWGLNYLLSSPLIRDRALRP